MPERSEPTTTPKGLSAARRQNSRCSGSFSSSLSRSAFSSPSSSANFWSRKANCVSNAACCAAALATRSDRASAANFSACACAAAAPEQFACRPAPARPSQSGPASQTTRVTRFRLSARGVLVLDSAWAPDRPEPRLLASPSPLPPRILLLRFHFRSSPIQADSSQRSRSGAAVIPFSLMRRTSPARSALRTGTLTNADEERRAAADCRRHAACGHATMRL